MKQKYLEKLLTIAKSMNLCKVDDFGNTVPVSSITDVEELLFLPESNLLQATELDYSGCTCYGDMYQKMGRAGIFSFEPYISQQPSGPMLVLRHNKMVHLSDSGMFEILSEPTGTKMVDTSLYSTQPVRDAAFNSIGYDDFYRFIWWCHLISAAGRIDVFRRAFENKLEVIPQFLNKVSSHGECCYKDISSFIAVIPKGIEEEEGLKIFNISNKGELKCRVGIKLGDKYLVNTSRDGRERTLVFSETPYVEKILRIYISKYTELCKVNSLILHAMLELSGVSMNYGGWFPTEKLDRLTTCEPAPVQNLFDLERGLQV